MVSEIVRRHLVPERDYIFGFAGLRGLTSGKFAGYPYGISIGRRLDDKIVDAIAGGPTMEYYHHYHQINAELSSVANRIRTDLRNSCVEAVVVEPTVSTESKSFDRYLKTLTVEVSHKMVATRAGLGWIGKTDLFVSRAFGPRLRLVSLLMKQKPDGEPVPVDKSRCGKCTVCVELCPAGAANGKLWDVNVHRDEFFDAHLCRKKCGELAMEKLKVNVRICGLCVAVCPLGGKG